MKQVWYHSIDKRTVILTIITAVPDVEKVDHRIHLHIRDFCFFSTLKNHRTSRFHYFWLKLRAKPYNVEQIVIHFERTRYREIFILCISERLYTAYVNVTISWHCS